MKYHCVVCKKEFGNNDQKLFNHLMEEHSSNEILDKLNTIVKDLDKLTGVIKCKRNQFKGGKNGV